MSRGWATRGFTSPPYFGRSAPESWLSGTVRFYRGAAVETHGGFSAGEPVLYLTAAAHVEWGNAGEPSGPYDLGIGPVRRKVLRIVMAVPALPELYPKVGDAVEWTDDLGQTFRTSVRNIHSPLGLADHLEVECEAWR